MFACPDICTMASLYIRQQSSGHRHCDGKRRCHPPYGASHLVHARIGLFWRKLKSVVQRPFRAGPVKLLEATSIMPAGQS